VFDSFEGVADPVAQDVARLKRRFDPLLTGTTPALDDAAAEELRLLARIHDLDDAAPPTLLWGALRGRLEALLPAAPLREDRSWAPVDAAA